jgi:hypothetical protein
MEPNIREGAFVGGKAFAAWIPYEGVTIKLVYVDPENNQFLLWPENEKIPGPTPPHRRPRQPHHRQSRVGYAGGMMGN